MITATSTQYFKGEAPYFPELVRSRWLTDVLDFLEENPTEQVYYEREGDTLVIAARVGGEIRWFDCIMQRSGRVRRGKP